MKKLKTTGKSMGSILRMPERFSKSQSSPPPNAKPGKNVGGASEGSAVLKSSLSLKKLTSKAVSNVESSQHGSQHPGTEEGITRFSLAEGQFRQKGRTDWEKLKSLSDKDIALSISGDPDAMPADFDWSNAQVYFPKGKLAISLRIDPDVLAFFKSTGKGFQTRMNAVLRVYMEHQRELRSKK